jgi:hypothetical protein
MDEQVIPILRVANAADAVRMATGGGSARQAAEPRRAARAWEAMRDLPAHDRSGRVPFSVVDPW